MFIIGSYHKTGTELFKNIWNTYKKLLPTSENNINGKIYDFYHHFNDVTDEKIHKHKCVVIIRNPYEIIMSGVRYHQTTNEVWCCRPQQKLNNLSYKEYISSLHDNDKILFEIKNCGHHTLKHIYNDMKFRNFHNNIYFIKLEDLYNLDNIPIICKNIVQHLEGDNININLLINSFKTNLSKNFHRTNKINDYTYQNFFKEEHYEVLNKLFPNDICVIMGY